MKNQRAFPVSGYYQEEGMTLRDYFAAKAMEGDLAAQDARSDGKGTGVVEGDCLGFARRCYKIADAMLKAREVQP